eukprot:TRINITY_DN12168_c0_g1_i2.p1 TRINITY_DN12168_c0_g1~~TRINITY_DN12168_c0_g1_i2.p1  ORF type:complete len:513 (+),score=143.72 TRINITY_DN12168_c0_g1_i2:51-1589(+)
MAVSVIRLLVPASLCLMMARLAAADYDDTEEKSEEEEEEKGPKKDELTVMREGLSEEALEKFPWAMESLTLLSMLYNGAVTDAYSVTGTTPTPEQIKTSGTTEAEEVYGEIRPDGVVNMLARMNATPGMRFFDLGSGTGKVVYTAWLLGLRASGVEVFDYRHSAACVRINRARSLWESQPKLEEIQRLRNPQQPQAPPVPPMPQQNLLQQTSPLSSQFPSSDFHHLQQTHGQPMQQQFQQLQQLQQVQQLQILQQIQQLQQQQALQMQQWQTSPLQLEQYQKLQQVQQIQQLQHMQQLQQLQQVQQLQQLQQQQQLQQLQAQQPFQPQLQPFPYPQEFQAPQAQMGQMPQRQEHQQQQHHHTSMVKYTASKSPLLSAAPHLSFHRSKFQHVDTSDADVVFVDSVMFSDETMADLADMFRKMKPGTIIALQRTLPGPGLEEIGEFTVPVSWSENSTVGLWNVTGEGVDVPYDETRRTWTPTPPPTVLQEEPPPSMSMDEWLAENHTVPPVCVL